MYAGSEDGLYRMSRVFFDAPCMMAITASDEGRIIEVNTRFELETGYSRDELVGRAMTECRDMVSSAEWTSIQETVAKETLLSNHEFVFRTKSGMLRDGLISGTIQNLNENSCVIWVINDITEQKNSMYCRDGKTFQKSEDKYRRLVEDLNEVVYSLDQQACITYISPNVKELAGYECSEVLGKPFTDFVYHEDLTGRMERFQNIINGSVSATEYRIVTKSGGVRWVRTAARPISGSDSGGVRGVLMDITERVLAEEEREELKKRFLYDRKMEAVGALAGGVAHDLNNVLTGLVSLPELMLMEIPEDSSLREPLSTIRKSGEKAATMVQDLLSMARRGVKIDSVVSLNRVIEDYLKTPEYELLRKYHPHVRFEVRLDETLCNIKGSPVHLAKTVMNLLSNAAEAIGKGEGYVRLITENRRVKAYMGTYGRVGEGEYVVLMVSDTGAKMSSVDRERIFEPFYAKKILGRSGTGMGMTVVWGCVQDHRGYIDLESEESKGTTLTLYFPAVNEVLQDEERKNIESSCDGKGEVILVVDDVAEQREIASLILSNRGYSVATAPGGEEALEYLEKSRADVVLLDMIMDPGIDGLETVKRVFRKNPHQKVIIVSGYSESAQVKEAMQLGAAGYVTKPYRIETLAMTVRRELDRR